MCVSCRTPVPAAMEMQLFYVQVFFRMGIAYSTAVRLHCNKSSPCDASKAGNACVLPQHS